MLTQIKATLDSVPFIHLSPFSIIPKQMDRTGIISLLRVFIITSGYVQSVNGYSCFTILWCVEPLNALLTLKRQQCQTKHLVIQNISFTLLISPRLFLWGGLER